MRVIERSIAALAGVMGVMAGAAMAENNSTQAPLINMTDRVSPQFHQGKGMRKSIGCVAAMICAMGIAGEVAAAENNSSLAPLVVAPLVAPSFDCRKARTSTEKMICRTLALGTLDSSMSTVYRRLKTQLTASERRGLVLKQRAWLKKVRDVCGAEDCIAQAYIARLAELQSGKKLSPNSIKQVALGLNHSCVLNAGGAVLCRGNNESGQVGNGKHGGSVARLIRVVARGATSIATGDSHSCAVVKEALFCWGDNYYGEIGNGKSGLGSDVSRPLKVIAHGVKTVSAGGGHTCAVVRESLQCWGGSNRSQLGVAGAAVRPEEVLAKGVTEVASGRNHTCAIVDGALYCWGGNRNGQVGNAAAGITIPSPVKVIASGVTAVSAGEDHTCAIVNSALYCWGYNLSGEIGVNSHGDDVLKPELVIPHGVSAVSAAIVRPDDGSGGGAHTCAIVDAALYCWGDNFYGQIGNGPPGRDVYTPVKVIESGVSWISTGGRHTCAVVNEVEQCWRYGPYGEIDSRPPVASNTQPPSQIAQSDSGLGRYVGTYKGSLISQGTEFVVTHFFLSSSGEMVGEYTMIPYEGSSKKNEQGMLDSCKALPDNEFLCQWHDQYGNGLFALQFDDNASEFRGVWKPNGASNPPHMESKYWLWPTDWNGARQ